MRALFLLALLAFAALSFVAQAQEPGGPMVTGAVETDAVMQLVGKLGYPGALIWVGLRAVAIVERMLTMAESCWTHIRNDGLPHIVIRHEVRRRDEPFRDRDDDKTER